MRASPCPPQCVTPSLTVGVCRFAAVLSAQFKGLPGPLERVGVLISGGNVDLDAFRW